jgi:hypothetical protein
MVPPPPTGGRRGGGGNTTTTDRRRHGWTRIHLDGLWALICAGSMGLWRTGGSPGGWGARADGNNSGTNWVLTHPLFLGWDAPDANMQGQWAQE